MRPLGTRKLIEDPNRSMHCQKVAGEVVFEAPGSASDTYVSATVRVESPHEGWCMPKSSSRPKMGSNSDAAIDINEMFFLRQALAPGLTVRVPDEMVVFATCLPQLRRMSRELASTSLKSSKLAALRLRTFKRRSWHNSLRLSLSMRRRQLTKRSLRC
jgi:hypothetical protein